MVSMVERAKNEADEPKIRGKRGDNVRREEIALERACLLGVYWHTRLITRLLAIPNLKIG
jgi:hypothetical protein